MGLSAINLLNPMNSRNPSTFSRGRSSVWLERRPVTPEVASSSLVVPAILEETGGGEGRSGFSLRNKEGFFIFQSFFVGMTGFFCRFFRLNA